MNNQQTNSKRLVRKTELAPTEAREHLIGWICDTWQKAENLQSKMVINAFNPIGAPKHGGRVRHYNLYGGSTRYVSGRGDLNAR